MRRESPKARGILSARVRPGKDVIVVNISAGGALIDAPLRLLPGANVELQIETARRWDVVAGRVLRCAVARVRTNAVLYRAGIAFNAPLPAIGSASESARGVPDVEPRPALPAGVDTTRNAV
jgi:hypothetical protein